MTDIAILGIEVQSQELRTGEQRLDSFARKGEQTERRVERSAADMSKAMTRTARATRDLDQSAGRSAGNMRQTAMQLSQVAQQATATGDVVGAFSIQLADLALILGPAGILAGAAAGAVLPIIADFVRAGDAAEELTETLERLADTTQRLRDIQGTSFTDLRSEFGQQAEAARELLEIERQIIAARAQSALGRASLQIGEGFGALGGGVTASEIRDLDLAAEGVSLAFLEITDRLENTLDLTQEETAALLDQRAALADKGAALNQVGRQVRDVAEQFGVSREAALGVVAAASDLAAADGVGAQARAAGQLAEEIFTATGGLKDVTEETQSLYLQLLEAAKEGARLAGLDLTSNITSAADEAARLASNLTAAVQLSDIERSFGIRRGVESGALPPGALMDDPLGQSEQSAATTRALESIQAARRQRQQAPRRRSGGGGGGTSAADREMNEMLAERDRILEGLKTETDRYNDALAQADRLLKAGVLTGEQYEQHVANLRDELSATSYELTDMQQGILDVAVSGSDGFARLQDGIKRAALELLLFNKGPLAEAIAATSGGGSGGGLLSFVGKAFAGAFDKGGNIPAGQFGLVGERGPEIVTGPASVTSRADTARIMRGGGGTTDVRVIVGVDDQGNIATKAYVDGRSRDAAVQVVQENNRRVQRSNERYRKY